jgi:hypothetical protein
VILIWVKSQQSIAFHGFVNDRVPSNPSRREPSLKPLLDFKKAFFRDNLRIEKNTGPVRADKMVLKSFLDGPVVGRENCHR